MKDLLIYISPGDGFDREHEELTKMQIDNSLELAWEKKDIILATNFPWSYKGIKALVLKGDFGALDGNRSSKIPVINRLFDMGEIKDGDLVWFHDHDAFQLAPLKRPTGQANLWYTDQGWNPTWNAGSFFFNRGAVDIFLEIHKSMLERNTNEQDALTYLLANGLTGCEKINNTYNLGIYHIDRVMKTLKGPLLVAHFHPHKSHHLNLFRELIPGRLMDIFNRYGIS